MSLSHQHIDFNKINFVLIYFESLYTFMNLPRTTKNPNVLNYSTSLICKVSKY